MKPDIHGKNTILSLYFDTPDDLLIRRSLEKPLYKEKLRVRSYGIADTDTTVFVELKKKYQSVVYKRRIAMSEKEARRYLLSHASVMDTQISREIDYCLFHYHNLIPRMLLSYDRAAFYAMDNPQFRITFDENILWRDRRYNPYHRHRRHASASGRYHSDGSQNCRCHSSLAGSAAQPGKNI